MFKHGHILQNDISICEHKLRENTKHTLTKDKLKSLRGATSRERLLHRLHSVALVLNGFSASEAARLYGDSPRAVAYWVTRFNEDGARGLEEEERPGRPSKLNAIQFKKAQRFLQHSEAKSKQVTAEAFAEFISKEFRISLTPRHCWRILNRLKKS